MIASDKGMDRDEAAGRPTQRGRGRWLIHDPAGYVDGLNTYSFVRGQPVGGYDASGLRDVYDSPMDHVPDRDYGPDARRRAAEAAESERMVFERLQTWARAEKARLDKLLKAL